MDQVALVIGLDKSTMRSSQGIVIMPLDMHTIFGIVVGFVAFGFRADLLVREDLDSHLTKEHLVCIVELIVRFFRHSCEASEELNDAFDGFNQMQELFGMYKVRKAIVRKGCPKHDRDRK